MKSLRVLNPILKVHWAGWESDTLRLQRAGWQFSTEEDYLRRSIRIALKHPAFRIYGISRPIEYELMVNHETYLEHIVVPIDYMASDFKVQIIGDLSYFNPTDMEPQIVDSEPKSIEDFRLFRPLDKLNEIIVEPPSVTEMLDRILNYQSPKQAELRKRMLAEQYKRELGIKQVHAQIISLVA